MRKLSKFGPIARAIAVIGATAGLVTGVTFAALTSNTVALSPNTLTTASAQLKIGDANCGGLSTTSTPGFSSTNFSSNQPATVDFCLSNSGGVPLTITANVTSTDPGALNSSVAAQNTTLTVKCGNDAPVSGTLNTSWTTTFSTPLAVNNHESCTATATLSNGYSGAGGETIPNFSITFTGTEAAPQTT